MKPYCYEPIDLFVIVLLGILLMMLFASCDTPLQWDLRNPPHPTGSVSPDDYTRTQPEQY